MHLFGMRVRLESRLHLRAGTNCSYIEIQLRWSGAVDTRRHWLIHQSFTHAAHPSHTQAALSFQQWCILEMQYHRMHREGARWILRCWRQHFLFLCSLFETRVGALCKRRRSVMGQCHWIRILFSLQITHRVNGWQMFSFQQFIQFSSGKLLLNLGTLSFCTVDSQA